MDKKKRFRMGIQCAKVVSPEKIKRKENAKITYGAHPGRRRAYLPGRFEFLDAEGRVGCGIDGSTSLCRKMGKEVSETKKSCKKKEKMSCVGIEPTATRYLV